MCLFPICYPPRGGMSFCNSCKGMVCANRDLVKTYNLTHILPVSVGCHLKSNLGMALYCILNIFIGV